MTPGRGGRRVLAGSLAVALLAGCGLVGGGPGRSSTDPVFASALPSRTPALLAGPAYVASDPALQAPPTAVVGGRVATLPAGITQTAWLADGDLVALRQSRAGQRLARIDPRTGALLRSRHWSGQDVLGVTPEAVTVLGYDDNTVHVLTPRLREREVLKIRAAAVHSDQIAPPDATLSLHGRAVTLGGVTWVQWSINSEDDQKTDHGVLRIADGGPTETLRNQPVVELLPSSDGAALLVLMQDNGEAESCGGCTVEQKLIELDPADGAVAADYGMPPGYARDWRVEGADKVGDQVVVRFSVGEAGEGTVTRQTWVYDGSWRRLDDVADTRTTWQDGGSLVWRQVDTRHRDEGEGARARLAWHPTPSGATQQLIGQVTPCPRRWGRPTCPLIDAPGAWLPPS